MELLRFALRDLGVKTLLRYCNQIVQWVSDHGILF